MKLDGKIVSIFNNKGGVGKTTILWNLAVSLSEKGKNVLVIDFDPQCNLSIATLGYEGFAKLLDRDDNHPHAQTIRGYCQPYIFQTGSKKVFRFQPVKSTGKGKMDIVPGDFWLNNFADILDVAGDVISGNGLFRFTIPAQIGDQAQSDSMIMYDYILIDLPPSFNTLVRSALYCSDYFMVPCTPDLFSAYCVSLIGEVLPNFVEDWVQGTNRFERTNKLDGYTRTRGKPRFGGWIFNGFDMRKKRGSEIREEIGADKAQLLRIVQSVEKNLIPSLKKSITSYDPVPDFIRCDPIAKIEDLNVIAPDSIIQNIPIKLLPKARPTRDVAQGAWAKNQITLMEDVDTQFDSLADYMISNF